MKCVFYLYSVRKREKKGKENKRENVREKDRERECGKRTADSF